MISSEALLGGYITANILICVGFALWLMVRFVMTRFGLQGVHGTLLNLLNAAFVAVMVAPLILVSHSMLQSIGIAKGADLNLSDLLVSHYLNGGFEMKAADLEGLLSTRDRFTLSILNADGPVAIVTIALVLSGLVFGTVRLAHSVFCLWRIVRGSYAWRSFGRVKIRLSDRTLVPFSTRGLWTYYVILPSHMLSANSELKVSLAHEFQHIRQGDLEWEIVLEFLKPFFFLNPIFHRWKRQVENLRELHCDAQVLAKGRIGLKDYCETLLAVCQASLRRDRPFVAAVPKVTLVTAQRSSAATGGTSLLEYRVRMLLSGTGLGNKRLLFACAVVPLLVAMTLTTLAIQPPADWSQDRLMLATVVNLDRLEEINRLSAVSYNLSNESTYGSQ